MMSFIRSFRRIACRQWVPVPPAKFAASPINQDPSAEIFEDSELRVCRDCCLH